MTTHAERMARADRHVQELRRFLVADIEDWIVDAQHELDDDLARGRKHSAERRRRYLDELKAKRDKYRAELGPVPPYPKCGEDVA